RDRRAGARPPRPARRAPAARAAAHHRPLSTAERCGQPAQAAAPARADAVRVSDRPDAGETAFGRNRCGNSGTRLGFAGRPRFTRAVQGALHGGHAGGPQAGAAQFHQGRRSRPRNAAAARRRSLPARPGARHLREHRRAREAGLPRHQPRDPAADGRLGSRHHAVAGARRPRRVWQCTRRHHQAIHPAGPHAHHRRGVAQVECAAPRHPCIVQTDRGARLVNAATDRASGIAPHRAGANAAQAFRMPCADGRELAAHWITSAARRAVLVINPATGFPQTFYFRLASYAAERGYDTLVYDYRGMGASAPAALAGENSRMSDWGLLDMRTALAEAAARAGGLPVVTLGHSVGGQFLGLLTNHALARAHVQIAVSVGYWRWEHAPFRYLAWWFWRVHGPLMLKLKGYVPTGGGWAGLPLPRRVFEEWRTWCLRPGHFGPDLATYLSDNVFAQIRAPVLNVGFTDDPIATRRTVAELQRFYPNVERESRWYSPADAGSDRIGHDGFFASRHRDTLWRPVLDWLDAKLGSDA